MDRYEIFSKRERVRRGEVPDVYSYNVVPDALRAQVIHVMTDAVQANDDDSRRYLRLAEKQLALEWGVLQLPYARSNANRTDVPVFGCLLGADPVQALDIIEVLCRLVDIVLRDEEYYRESHECTDPDEALEEVNWRFREHQIGYQYNSRQLIRIDSEVIHQEVVQPALSLLHDPEFEGANDEFRKAHEHYRHGRYKEALVDCQKAFESTMKSICTLQGWAYEKQATAKNLIGLLFKQNLIPTFLQSHYDSLWSTLQNGIPTIRNNLGGHGQGEELVEVPEHFVAYQIHLTASAILFLVSCHESLSTK